MKMQTEKEASAGNCTACNNYFSFNRINEMKYRKALGRRKAMEQRSK